MGCGASNTAAVSQAEPGQPQSENSDRPQQGPSSQPEIVKDDSCGGPFADPADLSSAPHSRNSSGCNSPAFPTSPQVTSMELKDDESSSDERGAKGPAREARKERSKSLAVLEKISMSRSRRSGDGSDPFGEVEQYDDGAGRKTPEANFRTRTRRLSSVYNEFSEQVEAYLHRKAAVGRRGESSGSGSGSGSGVFVSSSDASSDVSSDSESSRNEFLQSIFDLLDQERNGFITIEMLRGGFRKMGYTDSHERLNTMFACADKNHDGVIDQAEFFSFFKELSHQDLATSEELDEDAVIASRRRSRAPSAFGVNVRNFHVRPICGLQGRVKTIATSPFRPLFAACDRDDHAIHLFDFKGTQQKLLQGHRDSMLGLAFSVDRKHLASASRDGTLVLWDCTVGHELGILQHPGVVTACTFSYDGKHIYTGCQDNLVRKYTVKKSRFVCVSERMPRSHLGVVVALGAQHHDDSEVVLSRSCDKCAIVLDGALKLKQNLEGHQSMVWQASYNSDGTLLVTSCESIVRVWSPTYECIGEFHSTQFHSAPGVVLNDRPRLWTTAQFCPPQFGPLVALFNSDTNIFFVAVPHKKLLLNVALKSAVYCACINDDMSAIICGDESGNITMIQLS